MAVIFVSTKPGRIHCIRVRLNFEDGDEPGCPSISAVAHLPCQRTPGHDGRHLFIWGDDGPANPVAW